MQRAGGYKSEAGFSLIEVLVAGVVFAFMAVAFAATFVNGRLLVVNGGARRQALTLAQNRMEEIKLNDFATLEGMVGNPETTNISIAGVDFLRTVSVAYVDDADYTVEVVGPTDSLKLLVTVSDNDPELDFSEVQLQTIVTNPE
jgi:Tfp pilus assembly protein PilV